MRDQFLLRPGVAYLNHGAYGAVPRPVFEAWQRRQREVEADPHHWLQAGLAAEMARVRAVLAAYVGAQADDLVLAPNATTALAVVARSLQLAPGDEVLSSDHEFGAIDKLWTYVCEQTGAKLVRQPVPTPIASPEAFVAQLWAGVTERTRVLAISHVTAPTSLVVPVAELAARARTQGIVTVVDGAHGPGQLPLALDELGADVYVGNGHKWLCAPKGTAFLQVRRELQPRIEPLVVSWGWRSWTPGPSRFVDEQEYTGTRDVAAWLTLPDAIAWVQTHVEPRRAELRALTQELRLQLAHLTQQEPLAPAAMHAQMVTTVLPSGDAFALQARLLAEHGVEVAANRWAGKPHLRVSMQVYNGAVDVERLLAGLRVLLGR